MPEDLRQYVFPNQPPIGRGSVGVVVLDGTQVRAVDGAALDLVDGIKLAGTAVTTTAAELNLLAGAGIPVAESKSVDPSQKATYYTDFLGDLLEDELAVATGNGTGNAVALSAGKGGRVEIKTASDDGAITANGSSIGLAGLNWQADAGGLVMEVRLQVDVITAVMFFVGFTDALPSTIEAPIFLVTTAIDSDADNACGIGFDTDGTTAQFFHGGTKATVDTTPAYSGAAPVAATYYTLRVEVSAAGAVQGFIDGTAIGAAVANAVTITTPLCPIIFVANRGAAARNVLVDYLWVQQTR